MATRTDESRFRSRTSETFTRIREDVISGKFAPGTKLKIEEIARALDVGATPVREALSSLSSDGLVVRQDQRGFRVAEISASEFGELLDIRCLVEERALRLAIERGGNDWIEGIVLARHRLQTSSRSGEFDLEWERCHKSFHMALNAACGSSILLRLCNQFFDENNRYRSIARTTGSASRDVGCEHEAITEAVLARDADLAVTLLIDHYRRTGNLLQQALISKAQSIQTGPGTS
ncbi:MAG: GntR family transcriptional regulator [Alphaproteobacteria bacterium]|nr:GntR family transcriptional regulator [Alphaproteobacteria bacterium]